MASTQRHPMERSPVHSLVRFLTRATTPAMLLVVVLRLTGHLTPEEGLLDILVLFVLGIAARVIWRSWQAGSPKP